MLTLASGSATRAKMLTDAAVPHHVVPARVDEAMVKEALLVEGHAPRAVADALAELKALRVRTEGLVLGCDQVLALGDDLISKPRDRADAVAILTAMSGKRHRLHSAAVLAEDGKPVWRYVADVTMMMRPCTPAYLTDYVDRNWEVIRHSAGAYTLEGEGARLFHQVQGDMFAVMGLPLLPLLGYLATRGDIAT